MHKHAVRRDANTASSQTAPPRLGKPPGQYLLPVFMGISVHPGPGRGVYLWYKDVLHTPPLCLKRGHICFAFIHSSLFAAPLTQVCLSPSLHVAHLSFIEAHRHLLPPSSACSPPSSPHSFPAFLLCGPFSSCQHSQPAGRGCQLEAKQSLGPSGPATLFNPLLVFLLLFW